MLTRDEVDSKKLRYYIFQESQAPEKWIEQICEQAILAIELQEKLDTQPQVTNYDEVAELKAQNKALKDKLKKIEDRCNEINSMKDDHALDLAEKIKATIIDNA